MYDGVPNIPYFFIFLGAQAPATVALSATLARVKVVCVPLVEKP